MDEAYVFKNGKAEWGNENWTVEGHDEFNPNVEFAVNRRIKDVVADLQGNYDPQNRADVQRYWYGQLAFFLRKWMVRGMQRRWRGLDTTDKELQDIDLHKRFYSEAQGEFKEGTYTSMARFLRTMWRQGNMLKFSVMSQEYSKLTDMERGNIRSAIWEFSLMVGALAAATMLAKMGDEEEDEDTRAALFTLAYLMRRQYGELLTYTPMGISGEGMRTLRTPSAAMSTIELGMRTLGYLKDDAIGLTFGDGAIRYERGDHKDELKSYVTLMKLINPFYKNFGDRDVEKSYDFLANARYN
jgi:hypothetical protein